MKKTVIFLCMMAAIMFSGNAYAQEVVEEEFEVPFAILEQRPTFNGGDIDAFYDWMYANLKYPEKALNQGIQGRVIVRFKITEKGKLEDIRILYGSHELFKAEVVRILSVCPHWAPGLQRNKPVKVDITLPVVFELDGLKKPEVVTNSGIVEIFRSIDGELRCSIDYFIKGEEMEE